MNPVKKNLLNLPSEIDGLDLLPCGILVTDGEGLINQSNRYLGELLGYHSSELTGMHLGDLLPTPSQLFTDVYIWPTILKEGSISEVSFYVSHRVGHQFPVLINVETKVLEGQSLYVWAIFPADGRSKMEKELIQARQLADETAQQLSDFSNELKASNESLSDFAYMVSHDIRSPLIALRKLLEILNDDPDGDMKTRVSSQLFRRIGKLDELVQGLLDYARSSNRYEKFEIVNLPSFLTDIFELLHRPDTFRFEYNSQIEDIETQPVLLAFVLRNLISNAIKYHDREDGCVIIRCANDGDEYVFSVSDDGPGIASEDHEDIFRAFKRVVENSKVEGSGLGLAIVQKTILAYGGNISVQSDLGEGACFQFTWPKTKIRVK